jgi:ubiquinol-cytochrome c reductase cytochrome c subunit
VRIARLSLVVPFVVAAAVGGCTYFDEPEPYRPEVYYQPLDPETEALGRRLYQRDCAFCHGNEAQGTARGPDLVSGVNGPALTDFMLRTGRMPINHPASRDDAAGSVYAESEIAAVVAYLAEVFEQSGPEIPTADPDRGSVAAGQALYAEHCAACHATTGIGGAMLAEQEGGGPPEGVSIPSLSGSSPLEVAEAMRTGPGAMPVFGSAVVDDRELDSLTAYVEYLHDPEDRGGAPILRVGPVVEGAVGWFLGLGLLMLFARWVGTTRAMGGTDHGHG